MEGNSMTRTRAFVILSFVLMFAAGGALGMLISRHGHSSQARSRLAKELNLSADQDAQMRKVWTESMNSRQRDRERQDVLVQDRDQAILALLDGAQRAKYEGILQDYSRKTSDLDQERRKAFEQSVKKLLTAEQAVKYDDWMKKQGDRSGPGGRRHRGTATSRSTTQQQTEQSAPHRGE